MKKIRKVLLTFGVVILLGTTLSACKEKYEVHDGYVSTVLTIDNQRVSPFNTEVMIRCFSSKTYEKVFPIFESRMKEMHKDFDSHYKYKDEDGNLINNLLVINESYGSNESIPVSDDLFGLLEQAIAMTKLTKGYFNPTVGHLSDVWKYETKEDGSKQERFSAYCFEGIDPTTSEIEEGLESVVPYNDIESVLVLDKDNKTVTFKKYKEVESIKLTLSAMSKGYAIETLKKELEIYDKPLMLNGGSSSSYAIYDNPNPERDYWVVAIAAPYPTILSVPELTRVKMNGTYTLSVSGDYQNCYYVTDGDEKIIRHHIINPYTGYPSNEKRVLALWSDKESGVLDALSTALFSIEADQILSVINDVNRYYDMDIEVMYEVEVMEKRVDVYATQRFHDIMTTYNNTYYNETHIIEESLGDDNA